MPKSHIWQHLLTRHPEGLADLRGNFQFRVVERGDTAFRRQIAEAILIKNSETLKMNNKQMYNRCIIPDLGDDAPWVEQESDVTRKAKENTDEDVDRKSKEVS